MSTGLWLNEQSVENVFLSIADVRPMKNKHTLDFVSFGTDFKDKMRKALKDGKVQKDTLYNPMDFFQKTDVIQTYVNTKRLKGTIDDEEFQFEGYVPRLETWHSFDNGRMKVDKRKYFTNYPQDMLLGRYSGPIIPVKKLDGLPTFVLRDNFELCITT